MSELGIDVIEKDIELVGGIISKVLIAMDDGKISVREGFSLAMSVPKAWKALRSGKELIAQIRDLDPDESKIVLEKLFAEYEEIISKQK